MSKERWVTREGSRVFLSEENDGYTFMNRGAEPRSTEIVSADENGIKLVDGSSVSSSSGGLQNEAMKYFAQIAAESNR